eukprot:scaffold503_cov375-Pinguiococcus_pyrenoidosus.AAC.6
MKRLLSSSSIQIQRVARGFFGRQVIRARRLLKALGSENDSLPCVRQAAREARMELAEFIAMVSGNLRASAANPLLTLSVRRSDLRKLLPTKRTTGGRTGIVASNAILAEAWSRSRVPRTSVARGGRLQEVLLDELLLDELLLDELLLKQLPNLLDSRKSFVCFTRIESFASFSAYPHGPRGAAIARRGTLAVLLFPA